MKKISKCVIGIVALLVANIVNMYAKINCVYANTYHTIDEKEKST